MAGFSDVAALLNYVTLGEVYADAGREEQARNPLYETYAGQAGRDYETDEVEFIKLSAVQTPAPINLRDAPAHVLQPTGKEKRALFMLHMFNVMKFSGASLMMLRSPTEYTIQNKAREELTQQLEDFATKHSLTKQVFCSLAMTNATIYVDEDDQFTATQPSSGNRKYSISTGIPAANLSQINWGGTVGPVPGTNIIDVPWDNPSAKILDHLDYINMVAEYQKSERCKHVWLHPLAKVWLRNNNQILEMYGLNKEGGAPRLDNELRNDTWELNNYTFHFYGGSYRDSADSDQYFCPTTKAIITPDPGRWIANGRGREWVPTSFNPGPFEQANSWNEVYGEFSYAVQQHNPPSVELYSGDNWVFGFRNPQSIFAPTVDF